MQKKYLSVPVSAGGVAEQGRRGCNTDFVRSASSVRSFPLSRTYEGCWGGGGVGREGGREAGERDGSSLAGGNRAAEAQASASRCTKRRVQRGMEQRQKQSHRCVFSDLEE